MFKKIIALVCIISACLPTMHGAQPGPNHNMPSPKGLTITKQANGFKVVVAGTLVSIPNTEIIIQFHGIPKSQSDPFVGGRYMGQITVQTNASGRAVIEELIPDERNRSFPLPGPDIDQVTVTASRVSDVALFQQAASQGIETSQYASFPILQEALQVQ